ncbi:DUF2203 domain-containing protein [archaeon]|nr:DUF2203 domain-containing protein [archaeon]
MTLKEFSIDEANKLIPKIKMIFDEIFVLKKKTAFVRDEMKWIKEFWGNDLNDSDNIDADSYRKFEQEININLKRIDQSLKKIEKFGCIVKDVDGGLVDFYSVVKGKKIFLCWQYGETNIRYWHSADVGIHERRPVAEIEKIAERK